MLMHESCYLLIESTVMVFMMDIELNKRWA